MDRHQRRLILSRVLLLGLPFALGSSAYAAKPVDLLHQNVFRIFSSANLNSNGLTIKELNRSFDVKQNLHIRVQQTYNGYLIWGADAVVHIPHDGKSLSRASLSALAANNGASMNGIFYEGLNADLANTPAAVFTEAQAQSALQHAIEAYQQKVSAKPEIKNQQSQLMVYVDDKNKAHWAFKVSFEASPVKVGEIPAQPIYIMDAVTFKVFEDWNDMKTIDRDPTSGGGYGGNQKMGKLVYDGLTGHLDKLSIKRDGATATCYLQNKDVTVKRCVESDFWGQCRKSVEFTTVCGATDPEHNDVYWNGETDTVNGGYSPSNDALFNGAIIKDLYQKWYNVPVLKNPDKSPMMLTMIVHLPMDNAYWDGSTMNFGDGISMFYPLTSLGVSAHEISHGFTTQHSNLTYKKQSGGMNEAFSDMAAQAAEVFAYGKNSWQIGPEIFKQEGKALRYMDKPSKDGRSIDDASQYKDSIDVHYTSGVYNRFFYTLGKTDGWDVRKAFNVMIQAQYHWTANETFSSGACGVITGAKDLDYDVNAVKAAFDVVKVDYSKC